MRRKNIFRGAAILSASRRDAGSTNFAGRLFIWPFWAALLALAIVGPTGAIPPQGLTFPPLEFSPPEVEKVTLDNGLILYLLEDHELPLIDLSARIGTGSVYEPADKVGLASLFGAVLRTGGTTTRSPEEINEQLEFIAASVETGMAQEYGTARMSTLAKDLDQALEIFADVLRHPAFREDQIQLQKQQMLEAIRRRNDQASDIVGREFRKLIYGRDHPYGWHTEVETVLNITREDLLAWHAKYYHPNNVRLALSGDFDRDAMIAKIEAAFQGWEPAEIHFPDVAPVPRRFQKSVHYIPKAINQSHIWLGHLGIERRNLTDRYPLEVMNFILGGSGFTSRLVNEVRTKRGLAYVTGSYYTISDQPGLLVALSQTREDATAQAIEVMLDVLRQIRAEPVSDEEIRVAKDSLINSYVFNYASSHQIVSDKMVFDYFHYPEDYLATYPDKIAAVTKEDVQRVAQQYLHPDEATLLVVGRAEGFDKPLSTFGEVNTIELKEPEIPE